MKPSSYGLNQFTTAENSFKVTYYIFYEIQGRSVRFKTYAKQMSIASVSEMESPVAPFTNIYFIIAWISNYIHYKLWDEIIYPLLNFNGETVEV